MTQHNEDSQQWHEKQHEQQCFLQNTEKVVREAVVTEGLQGFLLSTGWFSAWDNSHSQSGVHLGTLINLFFQIKKHPTWLKCQKPFRIMCFDLM